MAADFLHEPLGQDRKPDRGPPGPRRWGIGLIAIAVLVLGAGGYWEWRKKAASRDQAGVVATIEPAKPAPPSAPVEPAAPKTVLSGNDIDDESGVKVVRPPGTSASGAAIIKVPQDLTVSLQRAPDLRLVEKTRFGLLPRRGPDGSRPADVYARPVVIEGGTPANAPRIALLVGGMGLNAALTAAASTELPPAVTLGFAPYGDDLERQVQAARDAGHEAVLQVPMEGFGDPPSATMSHLLVTGLDNRELLDRLHWHMGRFTGYVGVANFLGGKFTADDSALTPVLRDVAGRGLFYFDDGTSPRSLAPNLAPTLAMPLIRADVVIDATSDPASIDAALSKLEARAREKGFAVGVASGLPASIGRITRFAQKLGARGLSLVPVSAFAAVQGAATNVVARP